MPTGEPARAVGPGPRVGPAPRRPSARAPGLGEAGAYLDLPAGAYLVRARGLPLRQMACWSVANLDARLRVLVHSHDWPWLPDRIVDLRAGDLSP
jgi:hypothetical protein